MLGAFVPLVVIFLPGHQRPVWLPGGVALARIWTVVWASLALDIQPILVPASDSISKRRFSFRIAYIPCLLFIGGQLSDRRPGGLPLTACI